MAHPHKEYDPDGPLPRLREICLALPEATEKEAWGECTFRVGGKMFAMTDNDHHESGHIAVWVKAPPMVQEILVASDPKRFFKPPYVGHKGWVGVRLDVKVVWDELAAILRDGYLMSAPKRLVESMPAEASASQRAKPAIKPKVRTKTAPSKRAARATR